MCGILGISRDRKGDPVSDHEWAALDEWVVKPLSNLMQGAPEAMHEEIRLFFRQKGRVVVMLEGKKAQVRYA
jgi:hypothetical protein